MASQQHKRSWPRVVAVIAIALIVGGAVAWRFAPHQKPEPTPQMQTATQSMVASVVVSPAPPSPTTEPATKRERLISEAWKMRGTPYLFGAKGPDKLDCSGFTKACYAGIGVQLPDGSFNQAEDELPLDSLDDLVAGDLLFYRWAGKKAVSHVTMYAGQGWVIGTGSPGQPAEVVVYPITDDLKDDGRVITYRHVELADEAD